MSTTTATLLGTLGLTRPEWFERAACRGFAELHGGAERDLVFFPHSGMSVRAGRELCADCPVKVECLDYALDARIKHGIWGGLTERERRTLRRDRNVARRSTS